MALKLAFFIEPLVAYITVVVPPCGLGSQFLGLRGETSAKTGGSWSTAGGLTFPCLDFALRTIIRGAKVCLENAR